MAIAQLFTIERWTEKRIQRDLGLKVRPETIYRTVRRGLAMLKAEGPLVRRPINEIFALFGAHDQSQSTTVEAGHG